MGNINDPLHVSIHESCVPVYRVSPEEVLSFYSSFLQNPPTTSRSDGANTASSAERWLISASQFDCMLQRMAVQRNNRRKGGGHARFDSTPIPSPAVEVRTPIRSTSSAQSNAARSPNLSQLPRALKRQSAYGGKGTGKLPMYSRRSVMAARRSASSKNARQREHCNVYSVFWRVWETEQDLAASQCTSFARLPVGCRRISVRALFVTLMLCCHGTLMSKLAYVAGAFLNARGQLDSSGVYEMVYATHVALCATFKQSNRPDKSDVSASDTEVVQLAVDGDLATQSRSFEVQAPPELIERAFATYAMRPSDISSKKQKRRKSWKEQIKQTATHIIALARQLDGHNCNVMTFSQLLAVLLLNPPILTVLCLRSLCVDGPAFMYAAAWLLDLPLRKRRALLSLHFVRYLPSMRRSPRNFSYIFPVYDTAHMVSNRITHSRYLYIAQQIPSFSCDYDKLFADYEQLVEARVTAVRKPLRSQRGGRSHADDADGLDVIYAGPIGTGDEKEAETLANDANESLSALVGLPGVRNVASFLPMINFKQEMVLRLDLRVTRGTAPCYVHMLYDGTGVVEHTATARTRGQHTARDNVSRTDTRSLAGRRVSSFQLRECLRCRTPFYNPAVFRQHFGATLSGGAGTRKSLRMSDNQNMRADFAEAKSAPSVPFVDVPSVWFVLPSVQSAREAGLHELHMRSVWTELGNISKGKDLSSTEGKRSPEHGGRDSPARTAWHEVRTDAQFLGSPGAPSGSRRIGSDSRNVARRKPVTTHGGVLEDIRSFYGRRMHLATKEMLDTRRGSLGGMDIRKHALNSLTQISEEEIQYLVTVVKKIKRLFSSIDDDGNGTLSLDELRQAVKVMQVDSVDALPYVQTLNAKSLSSEPEPDTTSSSWKARRWIKVRSVLNQLDSMKEDISFEEFVHIYLVDIPTRVVKQVCSHVHMTPVSRFLIKILSALFEEQDVDFDGYVKLRTMLLACSRNRMTADLIWGLRIKRVALDRDVSFESFLERLFGHRGKRLFSKIISWARMYPVRVLSQRQQAELARLFDLYDQDKDGTISLEEMKSAFMQMGLGTEEQKALFEALDTDNSGEVDLQEFKVFYRNIWEMEAIR